MRKSLSTVQVDSNTEVGSARRLMRGLSPLAFAFLSGVLTLTSPTAYADKFCRPFEPVATIPDGNTTGVTREFVVPSTYTASIQDLDVGIIIAHSWVGDLIVRLTHVESGVSAVLIDRMGRPATATSGAGCSGNNLNVLLDDEGTGGAIEALCGANIPTSPPSFTPNNPLSVFDGLPIAGTWRINVADVASIDTGSLGRVCLTWNSTDLESAVFTSTVIAPVGGNTLTTFQFKNNGAFAAENVPVSAFLPAQLGIIDIAAPGNDLAISSGGPFSVITSTIPIIPAGGSAVINVQSVASTVTLLGGGGLPPVSTRLLINSPSGAPREIPAYPLNFDATLHPAVVTAPVVLANDGVATAPNGRTTDGCEPLSAVDVSGKVVLVDGIFSPLPGYTGTPLPPPCNVDTQLVNARNAGAVGLIVQQITNNAGPFLSPVPTPSGGRAIPAVVVSNLLGGSLRAGGNVTMELGRAGVWEVFGQSVVSNPDDLNPANDGVYFTLNVGKDADRDEAPDALDSCPIDAAKVTPGICGCGKVDSTLDFNFNTTPDCNEAPGSIVPPKAKLRQIKRNVRVTMPRLEGASYIARVSVKAPGARKARIRTVRSTRNVLTVAGVAARSQVEVTYTVSLSAPSVLASPTSEVAKLRLR